MTNISVLMVFCENDKYEFIEEALFSLVNQSKRPTEVILIQNGYYKKNNLEKIKEIFLKKLNLKFFTIKKNNGLANALNFGLSKCKYELVARMDPDDISLYERFLIQSEFMNQNPHIPASSAWIEEFNNDLSVSKGIRNTPIGDITIKNKYAKLRSPLNHIPSIFRKSIIIKLGGYPNFVKGQDYALWSLLLVNGYTLKNIPKVLAKVRSANEKTDRRGILRLYSEVPLLFYQYKISFLKLHEFVFSFIMRLIIRLLPYSLRKVIFKKLRYKKN